jgi:Zn-dependent protease
MPVRTNIPLARVFGIRIGVGLSWFVVLFFFIVIATKDFHRILGGSLTTAYLVCAASALSFLASVILHELGHALVARRNGLTVAGIDLWAFGGITRVSESPTAAVELRVAAAGPLVTAGVIAACALASRLVVHGHNFLDVAVAKNGVRATPVLVWLSWVATINAFVLLFNLLPAFPLDGGRIAHALLWWRTGDRNRATQATGRAGQAFALLFGVLGMLWFAAGGAFSGLLTMVLAFILYQSAGAAVVQGSIGRRMQNITVADIMDREPVTIPAGETLLDAREQFFLRYRWPWFAVVDPARRFLGVVRGARVEEEISAGRPALAVADVLEDDVLVRIDEAQPLATLLGSEGLGRLGAMVAVDDDGVLRGVVTLADVRKALRVAA